MAVNGSERQRRNARSTSDERPAETRRAAGGLTLHMRAYGAVGCEAAEET